MSFETRTVFGETVQIQIPTDDFPTQEQILKIDETAGEGCQHGWYESVSDKQSYGNEGKAKLHYRYWLPEGTPKGILIFTHGIMSQGGHASRIDGRPLDVAIIVDTFKAKGFAVYSRDQLGHGFSEGVRFYVPSWRENRDDLVQFAKLVSEKHSKDIPLFLSGESYGGCLTLLTTRYFQDFPEETPSNYDSTLLICPAIMGDIPPFPVTQILRYVLKPIAPTWTPFFMPNGVTAERIWRDPKVVDYYTEASRVKMGLDNIGAKMRLGTATSLLEALEEAQTKAVPGFNKPFCCIHGDKDEAVPIGGSELLVKECSTPKEDQEFHVLEGCPHGILADPTAEEAVEKMVAFIDKRMSTK